MKTERLVAHAFLDHFLEPDECTATDNQEVRRIDGEELLMRMLAATLRRNVRDSSFENLQQCLLHAFTRNVASDRGVFVLATNFVDLVDIDDALLGALNVAVGGLQKFEDDVLDVLTDIAGFG